MKDAWYSLEFACGIKSQWLKILELLFVSELRPLHDDLIQRQNNIYKYILHTSPNCF